MPVEPEPSNPYEAPKASLEGQTSVRGFWNGQVLMDAIGGVFWVGFGSFWLVLALVAWSNGQTDQGVSIPGVGTLVFGLFLLSRVQKAWPRARGVKA